MGVYDRETAQSLRLITAKGEACSWMQAQDAFGADPSKPWIMVTPASVIHSVRILFVSNSSSPLLMLLQGSGVETGKLKAIMPAVGFNPSLSDSVIRSDGSVLQIDSIEPVSPNGEVILWRLIFKR
jgi:hypothetical protein